MKIVDLSKIEYDSKTFVPKELYFSQESKDRADKHIGNKYNHLTVLEYIGNTTDSKKETIGKFKCDCGKTCFGGLSDVVHGYKTTCGCKYGRPQEESEKMTHLRRVARGIRRRCDGIEGTHIEQFQQYGLLGRKNLLGSTDIEIREKLLLIPDYAPDKQLDRVDNTGDYTISHPKYGNEIWEYFDKDLNKTFRCLGNLRWISVKENNLNRSNSVNVKTYYRDSYHEIRDILLSVQVRFGVQIQDFTFYKYKTKRNDGQYCYKYRAVFKDDYSTVYNKPRLNEKRMTFMDMYLKYTKTFKKFYPRLNIIEES